MSNAINDPKIMTHARENEEFDEARSDPLNFNSEPST